MKKVFIFLLLFSFFFIFIKKSAFATEPRYAVCDLCGYCPPSHPPSNWEKCAQCLYPGITDPYSNQTLLIDPQEKIPPTPYPGRQYTMLGCIRTNLGSFRQEGAAAGVVQVLLNIMFSIIGGVALLFIIYGAFVILTSQNSPERLNYGKQLVYGAIIGVIFSFSAVFIINLLASGVLKIPGFSSP